MGNFFDKIIDFMNMFFGPVQDWLKKGQAVLNILIAQVAEAEVYFPKVIERIRELVLSKKVILNQIKDAIEFENAQIDAANDVTDQVMQEFSNSPSHLSKTFVKTHVDKIAYIENHKNSDDQRDRAAYESGTLVDPTENNTGEYYQRHYLETFDRR